MGAGGMEVQAPMGAGGPTGLLWVPGVPWVPPHPQMMGAWRS